MSHQSGPSDTMEKFTSTVVIIEDTLSMFKEFISSQTVRKNYFPPDNNLESDWLVLSIEDPIIGR